MSAPAFSQAPAHQERLQIQRFCKVSAQDLKPGECYCSDNNSAMTTGRCVYQSFARGTNRLTDLLRVANNHVKNVPSAGSHSNTTWPQLGTNRNSIEWYFEDDDANQKMGKTLAEADRQVVGSMGRRIHLISNVYFVEEGFESKLKLDLDFFFGKRKLPEGQEVPGKGVGSVVDGLLAGTFAIGNWYRSILNLSLNSVSRGQMVSEKSNEIHVSCEEGGRCSVSDFDKLVLVTPTGSKDEDVGLEMTGMPYVTTNSNKEQIIQIDRLNYSLGEVKPKAELVTAAANTASSWSLLNPLRKTTPINNQSIQLKPGDVFVILNQTTDQRSRFTQLLGRGKDTDHTQMIITLRALLDDGKGSAVEPEALQPGTYTDEDRREMDRIPYSFEDVLRSSEISCPDGLRRPGSGEPMCIFRLTKMNSRYLAYPLKITFKGKINPADAPKNGKAPVLTPAELYAGKNGYLIVPRLRDGGHELHVEIDKSNDLAKDTRQSHRGAAGIKFPIGFYESSGRILFDPGRGRLIEE